MNDLKERSMRSVKRHRRYRKVDVQGKNFNLLRSTEATVETGQVKNQGHKQYPFMSRTLRKKNADFDSPSSSSADISVLLQQKAAHLE